MILAERLCLLVLDPDSGQDRASTDADRLQQAIAALVLVDLALAGRIRVDSGLVHTGNALPIAHPVLAEAAALLVGRGQRLPLEEAACTLRGRALRWRRRMLKALAARDVLELRVPFPFLRRYRLRSRQAWNESLALLQGARPGAADLAGTALALATEHAGVLPDLMPPEASRPLLNALAAIAVEGGNGHDFLLPLLRGR